MTQQTKGRRRWRLLTAAAVAAASTAAVPLGAAYAAPAAVTGGSLSWGVRQSFRNYITGPIGAGTITTAGGATQAGGNGVFTFPITGGSSDAGVADVASAGSVRFAGHHGILDVQLSDVRVAVAGGQGSIVVDAVSNEFIDTVTQGNPISYDDATFATLDLSGVTPAVSGNSITYANVPATLAADGSQILGSGNFYAAGEAIDPVTFSITVAEGTDPDPEPEGPTISDGALRWTLSEQVWGQASLNQCRAGIAPATVTAGAWNDPDAGIVLPIESAAYDPATGATTAALEGGFIVGNRSQGNYRVRFTNLTFITTAEGFGALTGDVAHSLGAGAPPADCNDERTWTTTEDVTIVVFPATAAERSTIGTTVVWAVTPPWADADPANSFAAELIEALPSSLQGHFRATGSATADGRKPASPLYLRFELEPASESSAATIDVIAELPTTEGGALTISVADATVELPALQLAPSGVRYQSSGQLSQITVTDTRTANPGWTITAAISDFTSPTDSFSGTGLGWTPALVSTGDEQTVSPGAAAAPGVGLGGRTLAAADPGAGVGTAVLGAALTLHAPTDIDPGVYTATLTVTVI